MMDKIPRDEWEWYGLAAHFCGAGRCLFHMATKVGDVVVSTVGRYRPSSIGDGDEEAEIGLDRKYETMVFSITGLCSCGCGQFDIDVGNERDFRGYNTPLDARNGHMEMCKKWSEKGTTDETD